MANAKEVQTLDQLQRLDHDTITRLEVKMDTVVTGQTTLSQAIDNKFAELGAKVLAHDNRLDNLESIVVQVKPVETVAEFRVLQGKFHDFELMTKWLRTIIIVEAVIISSIVIFFFIQIPQAIRNIGSLHL